MRGLGEQQPTLHGGEYRDREIAGTSRRTQFTATLHDSEPTTEPLSPGVKASDELNPCCLRLAGQFIGERAERATGCRPSIQAENSLGPGSQCGARIQLSEDRFLCSKNSLRLSCDHLADQSILVGKIMIELRLADLSLGADLLKARPFYTVGVHEPGRDLDYSPPRDSTPRGKRFTKHRS